MSKEETSKYALVEVPTQMGLAVNTPEGTTISEAELLVDIANKLNLILLDF